MMAFDFKKEYKELYMAKSNPTIIEIPKMNYIAVRGSGNPNTENSDYQHTIKLLYAVAYTIKMSKKHNYQIKGFFDYIVPPLEGFWWQENKKEIDYNKKDTMQFISLIRLPDFVTKKDFDWAIEEATKKKKQDFSRIEFFTYDEGICVQCLHLGSYDNEPITVNKMHEYIEENGFCLDITQSRYHHEIYLNNPNICDISKLKTVIRHPIKNKPNKLENGVEE